MDLGVTAPARGSVACLGNVRHASVVQRSLIEPGATAPAPLRPLPQLPIHGVADNDLDHAGRGHDYGRRLDIPFVQAERQPMVATGGQVVGPEAFGGQMAA